MPLQNSKENLLKYTEGWGKLCDFRPKSPFIPETVRDRPMEHIASFPQYKSHYTRAESRRKFLHPDLSLVKMYEFYKDSTAQPVSLAMYKKYSIVISIYDLSKLKRIQVKRVMRLKC